MCSHSTFDQLLRNNFSCNLLGIVPHVQNIHGAMAVCVTFSSMFGFDEPFISTGRKPERNIGEAQV